MKKLFAQVFCLLSISTSFSQQQPILFEPGIVSNDAAFGFTLSPDAKHGLWTRSNHGGRDTLYIMETVLKNGKASRPRIAPFSQEAARGQWKDIDPIFSPDGKSILFQSSRPVPGQPQRSGFDIWSVKKNSAGQWGPATHLGNIINSDSSESYASMANNGNIYFTGHLPDNRGGSDIYVSRYVNGAYQKPENIGISINTINRESNPFISPAEDYLLYFSSARNGFGEVDLYISFFYNGKWQASQNLGSPVNSAVAEFCPAVHTRQQRLYFSRREQTSSGMIENIYYVPFDVNKYRPKLP